MCREDLIRSGTHIIEHALPLHLPIPLCLTRLVRGDCPIQSELVGCNDLLTDEHAVLAGPAVLADFLCLVSEHRVGKQADLNLLPTQGLDAAGFCWRCG